MTTTTSHTFYEILNLPNPRHGESLNLSQDDLKVSYRRALLLHHPDKVLRKSSASEEPSWTAGILAPRYSIDEILHAYQTLSNPEARQRYDVQLKTTNSQLRTTQLDPDVRNTHLGVEAFDLDDLSYDEVSNTWRKACRCGNEIGYLVTEQELEHQAASGEIYVGCEGCSLFIKVLFGTATVNEELESYR